MDKEKFKELCTESGLDFKQISRHQQRITSVLDKKADTHLKILDTCRLDNDAVVDIRKIPLVESSVSEEKIASFIPAAGASSRFFGPLVPLIESLRANNIQNAVEESRKLVESGILKCSLRPIIQHFFESDPSEMSQTEIETFLQQVDLPKAFQQCNQSNLNFFEYKLREHDRYEFIQKNVFVINPQYEKEFRALNAQRENVLFYFQGEELSTVRFYKDGTPVTEDGNLSTVPAGHGTLIRTLVQLKKNQPELTCAFIRNVDNTPDLSLENIEFTKKVALYFSEIHKWMKCIRQALDGRDLKNAEYFAERILNLHSMKPPQGQTSSLVAVLKLIFHKPERILECENSASIDLLTKLYNQPLNILGQVPNLGKDIGGSPVFIDSPDGAVKLSIELPHVSESDKQEFLIDSEKKTYFNPVFVFSELSTKIDTEEIEDSPYWIVAKKQYRGEEVFYHETVLYELLGNSALANPIFIELPRTLFTPNKVIFDSMTR